MKLKEPLDSDCLFAVTKYSHKGQNQYEHKQP